MKTWAIAMLIGATIYAIADALARLAFRIDDLAWRVKLLESKP